MRSYLNSTIYVPVDRLKLPSTANVSDLEKGSMEDIEIKYRNKKYLFGCEIVSNEIEFVQEGEIFKPSKSTMKRVVLKSSISGSISKKKNDLTVLIEDSSSQSNNSKLIDTQAKCLREEIIDPEYDEF